MMCTGSCTGSPYIDCSICPYNPDNYRPRCPFQREPYYDPYPRPYYPIPFQPYTRHQFDAGTGGRDEFN